MLLVVRVSEIVGIQCIIYMCSRLGVYRHVRCIFPMALPLVCARTTHTHTHTIHTHYTHTLYTLQMRKQSVTRKEAVMTALVELV